MKINNEVMALMELSSKSIVDHFKMAMREKEIPETTANAVILSASAGESRIQETFQLFSNPNRIEKYFEKNFDYVKPHTVSLGKGSFQYIPVRKLLKKIVEDKTFCKHRKVLPPPSNPDDDSVLQDLEDGLLFKTSQSFISNRDALRLGLNYR